MLAARLARFCRATGDGGTGLQALARAAPAIATADVWVVVDGLALDVLVLELRRLYVNAANDHTCGFAPCLAFGAKGAPWFEHLCRRGLFLPLSFFLFYIHE